MKITKKTLTFLVSLTLIAINFPTAQATTNANKPVCNIAEQGMESTEVCIYKNGNLNQVYQQYRNRLAKSEQQHLLVQMPMIPKKVNIVNDNERVEITYKPSKTGLVVEQFFDGGVTTIAFKKVATNQIKVTTNMSAD